MGYRRDINITQLAKLSINQSNSQLTYFLILYWYLVKYKYDPGQTHARTYVPCIIPLVYTRYQVRRVIMQNKKGGLFHFKPKKGTRYIRTTENK